MYAFRCILNLNGVCNKAMVQGCLSSGFQNLHSKQGIITSVAFFNTASFSGIGKTNFGLVSNYSQYHSKRPRHNIIFDKGQMLHIDGLFKNIISRSVHITAVSLISNQPKVENASPSAKEKLKKAVKEYGSTVIVFHVFISLISLGTFYALVSSGVDISKLLQYIGITGNFASNAGTFVTAYAVHKIFAPVRISITLGATPFIVRYLRRVGVLKRPFDFLNF